MATKTVEEFKQELLKRLEMLRSSTIEASMGQKTLKEARFYEGRAAAYKTAMTLIGIMSAEK